MLRRGNYADPGFSAVAPGDLQGLCMCCLPTRGLAWPNCLSSIEFWGLTEASKLLTRSFLFPSPVGRGRNDVSPSATLIFNLSNRGSLGLSLNGHPGCGGIESGSRNIIRVLIREVIPAAYIQTPSAKRDQIMLFQEAQTASPCPTLAFTAPTTRGYSFVRPSANTSETDCTSMRSPHCVPVPCIST